MCSLFLIFLQIEASVLRAPSSRVETRGALIRDSGRKVGSSFEMKLRPNLHFFNAQAERAIDVNGHRIEMSRDLCLRQENIGSFFRSLRPNQAHSEWTLADETDTNFEAHSQRSLQGSSHVSNFQ